MATNNGAQAVTASTQTQERDRDLSHLPPLPELTEVGKRLLADARKAQAKDKRESGADQFHVRRGLNSEQKAYLVESFACFQSLSDIKDGFRKRYGLDLDERTLLSYNPDHRMCRVGKRLKALFAEARKAYIEETAKVAVAHQAHRLRLIERLIEKATTAKEFNAAAKLLELAAKETGSLIQHIEHRGAVTHVHATVEEAKAELAMRLQAMIDGGEILPAPVDTTVDATPSLLPPATEE